MKVTEDQVQAAARVIHADNYDHNEGPCGDAAKDGELLKCRCVILARDALNAALK